MSKSKWSRKTAKYDADNASAAKAILAEPDEHPKFMQEWARRLTARWAAECPSDKQQQELKFQ